MASLQDRLTALATRVGVQVKAMTPRLLPGGGTTGQVLTKTSASDYATSWQTPAAGGGGGGGGLTQAQVDQRARLAVIRYGVK